MDEGQFTYADSGLDFSLDVWGDLPAAVTLLRQELDALSTEGEPGRAAILLYQLGRHELALDHETEAAQHLLRAYTLRPQFRPTLRLARHLYLQRHDFRLVHKLLEAEARATRDPLLRCALLRQQAYVAWFKLGNPEGARLHLEEALRLDEVSLSTLTAMALLCVAQRDEKRRREVVQRQIDLVADEPLRAALRVTLASSQLQQNTADAIRTLEVAQAECPESSAVLSTMEAIHENAGDYPALTRLYSTRAEQESHSPAWAARQLARAGYLCRDVLEAPVNAVSLLKRAVNIEPQLGTTHDCFSLLLASGSYEAALGIGSLLYELAESPLESAAVAATLGDIARRWRSDTKTATAWYRRCLSNAPSYQPALEALSKILVAQGDMDELLAIHRGDLVATNDPALRAHRLYRIATLLEEQGQIEEAIANHREALTARASFLPSVAALEKIYASHERWAELLDLYEYRLEHESDVERLIHLLETMAHVWEQQLGNIDRAVRCLHRILSVDNDHLPAIRSAARLCHQSRRWREVVGLTEREVSLSNDPQRKAELLHRMGEVCEERLLELDRAFDYYQRALDHNPQYLPALRSLGRLCRQKGRWHELIEMQRTEAAATADPQQAIVLLVGIAEVYEEDLLEIDEAIKTYRTVLERRPGHLPTVEALARNLERIGRWRELVDLLEETLEAYEADEGKALLLLRMASLRNERLEDPRGAIRDLSRAQRLRPGLIPALGSLLHLYRDLTDTESITRTMLAELDALSDPSERANHSGHIATLLDRPGANPRRTALFYERSADSDTQSPWPLLALERIYGDLGMPRERAATVGRLADKSSDRAAAGELRVQQAMLIRHDDPAESLAIFDKAREHGVCPEFTHREREDLQQYATDPGARIGILAERIRRTKGASELACLHTDLARLHLLANNEESAEAAYREALKHSRTHLSATFGLGRLLERQGRWAERAELAEVEAASLESTGELAGALCDAAEIWLDRVNQAERAIPLFEQALKVLPGHAQAYLRLREIHQKEGDWSQLATLLRNQIAAVGVTRETGAMFRELATLYIEKLGQQRKAEACYRRALDVDPHDKESLLSLSSLFLQRNKWDKARDTLTQAEALETEPASLRELRRDLAQTYLALGEPREAVFALLRALDSKLDPPCDLYRLLVSAADQAGMPAEQADALERLAERTDDADEQLVSLRHAASLAADRLDDSHRGIALLQRALVLAPLDLGSIEYLATLFARADQRTAARQHLIASVSHHRAAIAKEPFSGHLYRQVGHIFRWQRYFDELYCTYCALQHLDDLDLTESGFVEQHGSRSAKRVRRALSYHVYESIVLPRQAHGPLRDFLRQNRRTLGRLISEKPSAYQLRRSARLTTTDPFWQALSSLVDWIDPAEIEVWISPAHSDDVIPTFFTRPALVVGGAIAARQGDWSEQDRFRLGHALGLLDEGALVLRDRSLREIRTLFDAFAELADRPLPIAEHSRDPAQIAVQRKTLSKALSRKDRKALIQSLQELAAATDEPQPLGRWAQSLSYGANHLGTVLSGSPNHALREFKGTPDPSRVDEVSELLQYIVSDEHFEARRAIGIASEAEEGRR